MINEKRLKKELQKRFDAFVRKCGMADDMKSYGYASCYDDVSDIIEQLAAKVVNAMMLCYMAIGISIFMAHKKEKKKPAGKGKAND